MTVIIYPHYGYPYPYDGYSYPYYGYPYPYNGCLKRLFVPVLRSFVRFASSDDSHPHYAYSYRNGTITRTAGGNFYAGRLTDTTTA